MLNEVLKNSISQGKSATVPQALQSVLLGYLEEHPNLSLNGLSKKCGVAEPTLRRISKGLTKTNPTIQNVVSLLLYISKTQSPYELVKLYPGPIGDFLRAMLPPDPGPELTLEQTESLNTALSDPEKFLIYSLASNGHGVSINTIADLFGINGSKHIEELICVDLIYEEHNRYFAKIENFSMNYRLFHRNFKALANFIKPDKLGENPLLSPMFHMITNGVTPEAYTQLIKIQSKALKKCAKVLFAPENKGSIPAFFLLGIDTLSDKAAYEWMESREKIND